MRKSSRNITVSSKQKELDEASANKLKQAEIAKQQKAQKEKESENTRLEKIRLAKESKDKADEDLEYLNRVDKHMSELVKDVLKPAKKSETNYVKIKDVKNLKHEKSNKILKNRKNNALKELGLNIDYIKVLHKNTFDSVTANTFPVQNHNLMIDTLTLPTNSKGFNRLLVVVDLWSKEIEFEPMKAEDNTYDPKTGNRTNKGNGLTSQKALDAFLEITKRDIIKLKDLASIRVDDGSELKKDFKKYMKNNNILLRTALAGRHRQLANVESANKLIATILFAYMNNVETETNEEFNN